MGVGKIAPLPGLAALAGEMRPSGRVNARGLRDYGIRLNGRIDVIARSLLIATKRAARKTVKQ